MHAVGPGSGFRISITLFNHDAVAYGLRERDGYQLRSGSMSDKRPHGQEVNEAMEAMLDEYMEQHRTDLRQVQ